MINNAIKKLAIKTHSSKVKFWGKIFGKTADYYII